jgi:hypothetical protein
MGLLPKEHGAYGQMAFPMVTALAVTGVSWPAVMIALATVAAFLAHEPAAIVLGLRGARARRDLGRRAAGWLLALGLLATAAAAAAWLASPSTARWSFLVPLGPVAVLSVAMIRGREKSWYGDVSAALAFSSVAVPMVVTAGHSLEAALAIAIPFAALFVTTTLAVRVVILRVRGGGNARAAATTRRAAFGLAGGATAALLWAISANVLPGSVFFAAAPGLLVTAVIAARPPGPARLRALGWTLMAVSVLTALTTITAARLPP